MIRKGSIDNQWIALAFEKKSVVAYVKLLFSVMRWYETY